MTFSFIIPTYGIKGIELTKKCLESLREYHYGSEVIVIDDGGYGDLSVDAKADLEDICKEYDAKVIHNTNNMGFAHSVNRGIDSCSSDIAIIYNNDITLDSPILEEAEKIFNSDSKIGIIGCLLYYPGKEKIQHGGFCRFPASNSFGHYDHGQLVSKANMALKSGYSIGVTGAVQFIRKAMTDKIGVYSTKYMNCYEDVEFCLRAWNNLWRVYYSANISAIHHEGATRGRTQQEKKSLGSWENELTSLIQYHKDADKIDIDVIEKEVNELNKNIKPVKTKKIGLIRNWALGDVILATGIIEKLKKDNPNDDIYLCVDDRIKDVFKNNPNIKKIYTNVDRLNAFCDKVIDLTNVYENDPKKPIWKSYGDYTFKNKYQDSEILPVMYSTHEDRANVILKLDGQNITDLSNIVLIHAPQSWKSRTLGIETWGDVLYGLWDLNYTTIIVGTSNDMVFLSNIKKPLFNMHNQFTISELRELIKMSKFFIGIDSSLLHLAQTTDVQSIGIFSCANPEYRVFNKKTRVVIPKDNCKFCLHDVETTIKLECKHGDNRCINSIDAEMILKEVY